MKDGKNIIILIFDTTQTKPSFQFPEQWRTWIFLTLDQSLINADFLILFGHYLFSQWLNTDTVVQHYTYQCQLQTTLCSLTVSVW